MNDQAQNKSASEKHENQWLSSVKKLENRLWNASEFDWNETYQKMRNNMKDEITYQKKTFERIHNELPETVKDFKKYAFETTSQAVTQTKEALSKYP